MTNEPYTETPEPSTRIAVADARDLGSFEEDAAEVFTWYQGSDGPFHGAMWRGRWYRMIPEDDD